MVGGRALWTTAPTAFGRIPLVNGTLSPRPPIPSPRVSLHGLRPPILELLGQSGPSTQNSPTYPPDSWDMRPAPRTPDTGPGTPHPPNLHTPLERSLCAQMLPPTPPQAPLPPTPWSASRTSQSSKRWPRSAAHFQPLGCSKTSPAPDTSWTPPNPQASNHQTPPHLWHQASTSGSPAARIFQMGPTCLQFRGA
ncbi:hypothetical protein HJG60_009045 [Phyllostomus discolor]|uniref:Uncharacterized protein n=1 Tax=Phyllostomus discolor TaxID=89673 RepID=A0A833YRQ9_9CHIR|nr:hypothetical protein HJG60_009045 [Phyllostomus discolor]